MNSSSEQERRLAERLRALTSDAGDGEPSRRRNPMRRLGDWGLGLGLAGCGAFLMFLPLTSYHQAAQEVRPQPVATVAEPAATKPAQVTGAGHVVARRSARVFARFEGRVTELAVALGDEVRAGQLLLRLDDPLARLGLSQAEAALAAAELSLAGRQVDLDEARLALARSERLAARKALSDERLDETRAKAARAANAADQARANIRAAALALAVAQEKSAALEIRAPISGTVTALAVHLGDSVPAQADARDEAGLLTVSDRTSQEIEAELAETALPMVRIGQTGTASLDADPDHAFPVTLLALSPSASREKGTVTLRLAVSNPPDLLRPGMAARIALSTDRTRTGETQ